MTNDQINVSRIKVIALKIEKDGRIEDNPTDSEFGQ
jgi:hypothetical protein